MTQLPIVSPVYYDPRTNRYTITIRHGEQVDNHREHTEREANRVRAVLVARAMRPA